MLWYSIYHAHNPMLECPTSICIYIYIYITYIYIYIYMQALRTDGQPNNMAGFPKGYSIILIRFNAWMQKNQIMCVFATADIQRKHDGYLHRPRSWTSREQEFNDSATRYFTDDLVPPEIRCKWIITIQPETNLNQTRKSIFLQDASVGNNYLLLFLRYCLSVWKT